MSARTYFDHAASSPMVAVAIEAMAGWWGVAGNPSSLHASGRAARRVLEESRESLAADLGVRSDEVIFTSGGTEANNLALLGAQREGRPKLAMSSIEHASVGGLRERRGSFEVFGVDTEGVVLPEALTTLTAEFALVSAVWVNNETGVIQDVAAIAETAHAVGAWAHSDAVQALGHVPVNVTEAGLDLVSVSAHKIGGPVGIGALVVRRGVRLAPVGFGGGQEARLRSGTVPVALAAGFAAASRAAVAALPSEAARLAALRDRLISAVRQQIPQTRLNTSSSASPAIVNLTFEGARADDVLLLLDAAGFDASTGSACTAGLHQPSEVLLAMGRTLDEAGSSLRFSFGPQTTTGDVDALLAVLPDAVGRARSAA